MLKKIVLVSLVSTLFSFHSLISEDVLRPGEIQPKVPKVVPKPVPKAVPIPNKQKLRFGVEGGVNVNFFSQDIHWDAGTTPVAEGFKRSTLYDPTASSMGFSPHFTILSDLSVDDYSAFQVRLGFESKNYSSKGQVQDISNKGDLVNVEAEFFDYSNWVSSAVNYRHRLYKGLFAMTGLQVDYLVPPAEIEYNITSLNQDVTAGSLRQVIEAQNNPNYQVRFRSHQSVNIKGKSPNEIVFGMRAGMNLGLGYQIELNDKFLIVPQVRFQYFITPPMKNQYINDIIAGTNLPLRTEFTNKRLHTLQLLLSVWYTY